MDQVKLRRYQNLLLISGSGVIVFGLWGLLKTILYYLTNLDLWKELLEDLPEGVSYKIIFFVILAIVAGIIIGVRLIIGLSARSEARGKKKRYFYLVLAFLLTFIDILLLGYDVYYLFTADIIDGVVALIVDVTSTVTTIEMIVAAFMVKKLTKVTKEA